MWAIWSHVRVAASLPSAGFDALSNFDYIRVRGFILNGAPFAYQRSSTARYALAVREEKLTIGAVWIEVFPRSDFVGLRAPVSKRAINCANSSVLRANERTAAAASSTIKAFRCVTSSVCLTIAFTWPRSPA